MKLLTVVIAPHRLARVITALDSAGLAATTVATAQASGLQDGKTVHNRGVEHRDQRCVRLEILVSDRNAEAAVALLAGAGGPEAGEPILWVADVDRPAIPKRLVGASATTSHT